MFRIASALKRIGVRWAPQNAEIIKTIILTNKKYGLNLKYKDSSNKTHKLLFVKKDNDNKPTYMTPDSLTAQLIRGCQHINIPVRTMHKIRKTYASILVNNGVEITIVKEMLGHASEETTFRHYIYNTR